MRDVGVRAHGGMVDLLDEAHELVHVLQERLVERLELEHDLEPLRVRRTRRLPRTICFAMSQIARTREHLAVPVVLADDEQHVAGTEVRALIDVRLDAVEREPAHRWIEVDDPERDADDGANPAGRPPRTCP